VSGFEFDQEIGSVVGVIHKHHGFYRVMQRGVVKVFNHTDNRTFHAKSVFHFLAYWIIPAKKTSTGFVDDEARLTVGGIRRIKIAAFRLYADHWKELVVNKGIT